MEVKMIRIAYPARTIAAGIVAAVALTIAAFSAGAAGAQTFVCAQAATPAEMAVCNSEDLLVADERLSAIYSVRLARDTSRSGQQELMRANARFVLARSACNADAACLDAVYAERLRDLAGEPPVAIRRSGRGSEG